MDAAPDAIPPNPKMAAAIAMMKNTRAQVSMGPPPFFLRFTGKKAGVKKL